ncbi:MAG: hypothetical protein PHN45_00115 [Methylococcales bacterium]|nr:hypothetical protein [Methylococcales bacterium]
MRAGMALHGPTILRDEKEARRCALLVTQMIKRHDAYYDPIVSTAYEIMHMLLDHRHHAGFLTRNTVRMIEHADIIRLNFLY